MSRPARQVLLAFVAAGMATLASWWLDRFMSVAGLAMVYLLAVAATAVTLDRTPGLVASVLCVSALNFFFVPPRYTFRVESAEYAWTLAVLLAVSLLLNALVASLRERSARAEQAQLRASRQHALGETLAAAREPAAMAAAAAEWFRRELGHSCAVFLRDGGGARPRCVAAGADAGAFDGSAAQWAMDHGRALGAGCDDWPDLPLWCAPFTAHDSRGALQLLLAPRERPDALEQQHWAALARQVGLAIDRERAAAEARDAQAHARAEAARNTLLASLSHDLRTPLAGILGTAGTLRAHGEAMPAAQREKLLANLENEARDLAAMADNVLQLARLSQPQAQLRRQWESLEEVLGAALARLRTRWPAARIQLRVTPSLPPIHGEAALLAQAVCNLVDNAVRHSPGEARIEITAGRSRGGVFIAVRDHGEGFGDADPAQLLERYVQGAQRDRSPGAAGLGLAICKLVADAHGGRIEARRCDPGAEFRIDLPVHEPVPAAAQ